MGLRRGWQRAATAVAMVAAVAGTTIVAYREVETRRAEARFVRAPIEDLRAYVDSRRLMDVATADLNELRQWFRGRIDFPIPGPGIGDSVRLAGGRLCFFLDRRIASTIYQAAGGRIVSLYIIPAHLNSLHSDASRVVAGEPVNLKSLGSYTQVMWRRGEIIYALVGELPTEQMMELSSVFLRSTLDPA